MREENDRKVNDDWASSTYKCTIYLLYPPFHASPSFAPSDVCQLAAGLS